ncbi:MAG: hypothetical protein A2X86_06760 [Bdellovibrionales bacterium GWA2_49_15]|nr:MAG: hypothetical protein A2X86_06760 [Bdellovibrionales bacterium GWA2_49_15]HAZ12025.1 hypothetical protein [Bdellovibrionales bacterium]
MVTGNVARPLGRRIGSGPNQMQDQVSVDNVDLNSLSQLTGFPVDFIKKELVVDQEKISVEDLRSKVAHFLNSTLGELPTN